MKFKCFTIYIKGGSTKFDLKISFKKISPPWFIYSVRIVASGTSVL